MPASIPICVAALPGPFLEDSAPPKDLYHYTSIEGLQGILRSRSVWATALQYVNDAMEFRLAMDIARVELRTQALKHRTEPRAALLEYYAEQLERLEQFNVCVFSLSEQGDLLSQWRGYCPSVGGYAIAFPGQELRELLVRRGFQLQQCVYTDSEHSALIRRAIGPFVASLPGNEQIPTGARELRDFAESLISPLFGQLAQVAARVKHASFAEEREWRVVWIPSGSGEPFRYRPSRGIFVPYVEVDLTTDSGQNISVDIIVGPMPHQKAATQSLSGFLSRERVKWNSIRPSQTPFRNW